MKKVSIYRPTTVDEAIQIFSQHGTEAGVYAGGTDLLVRLKNRLTQAPTYLVDIKKIDICATSKKTGQGGVGSARPPSCRRWPTHGDARRDTRCWCRRWG